MLVCQQIAKLEPVCIECATLVFEELQRIVAQIEAQVVYLRISILIPVRIWLALPHLEQLLWRLCTLYLPKTRNQLKK